MTDHEIRETDDRNAYFQKHVGGSDVIYFDGQYNESNFVPGFGQQIDALVEQANTSYREEAEKLGLDPSAKIIGASDRMMIFIPSPERGRKGVVFGRMNLGSSEHSFEDAIGSQSSVSSTYKSHNLTQVYRLDDQTQTL